MGNSRLHASFVGYFRATSYADFMGDEVLRTSVDADEAHW